tara:strand:+ start:318 stop:1109 length:792 start_codon:yes stop_codon:yes gene_type:complete
VSKKIRLAVLTQEDGFAIPKNIKLIDQMELVDLIAVVKIDATGSIRNKKTFFMRGFGLIQVGKMALALFFNQILNVIDKLFFFKLGLLKSLKSASVVCNSNYKTMKDPNDSSNIDWLARQEVDLVISYSAPCVFKSELLNIPKFGCINLHCSLLPKYAGLLPSFWTLYEKENILGATVHKMDDKIDNGVILGQVKVPRPSNPSMFNVIRDTKAAGGHLMVSVIKDILAGNIKTQSSQKETNDYYTWPTVDEIKEFRRNGGKLI